MAEVYALDTNVYIGAFRNPDRLAELKRFLLRHGTRVRLAAVVALELYIGAVTERHVEAVDELAAPYAARGRVIVPSFDAFVHAGRVCAALARQERYVHADAPASFRNDALLAASCREEDAVLVTENARDFQAIQRHLRGFRFTSALEQLRRG